jgi:hypothetical protein
VADVVPTAVTGPVLAVGAALTAATPAELERSTRVGVRKDATRRARRGPLFLICKIRITDAL